MKVVLVVLVLLVAGALYLLNDFGKVASPILANIVQSEGTVDAVQQAAQQPGFAAKYKNYLDDRYWLIRVSAVLDDDTLNAVAQDTYNRYNNTPLQNDPEFGTIILDWAGLLNTRLQFSDAGNLYGQYMTLFPNGDGAGIARGAILGLRVNHGIEVNGR